jgi:hypothetical protein
MDASPSFYPLQPLLSSKWTQIVLITNIPFVICKNNLIVQCVARCLHKEITNEVLEIASEVPYSVDMDKDWVSSVYKQSVNKRTH